MLAYLIHTQLRQIAAKHTHWGLIGILTFSPFLTISLCRAGQYLSHPVFSILCHVFSQLVFLHVCCPAIYFSVGLCSFSQKPLVLAISHTCGCVLASSGGQTTTLVFCFLGTVQPVVRLLPDVFNSDVIQPGLPSCPSQHPHFG